MKKIIVLALLVVFILGATFFPANASYDTLDCDAPTNTPKPTKIPTLKPTNVPPTLEPTKVPPTEEPTVVPPKKHKTKVPFVSYPTPTQEYCMEDCEFKELVIQLLREILAELVKLNNK